MGRKQKAKDCESQEYWDGRLAKEGMSMEAGTSRRITFVGGTQALENLMDARQAGTLKRGGKEVTYEQK